MNIPDNKRKACVVTYYKSYNYGSQLQSYALCRALEKLGFDAYIFSRFFVPAYFLKHPSLFIARLRNMLFRKERKAFFEAHPYEVNADRIKKNSAFIRDNYKELDINSASVWNETISDKTAFIAGSDIIWQPANGYPSHYLLDFAYFEDLQTMSYASSFGTQSIPEKYQSAYKKYLGAIDFLSVREEGSKQLLDQLVDKETTVVLDPTMLLTREDWDAFADKAYVKDVIPGKYILCYFVMDDPRYWNYLKLMQKELDIPVVVLPMHKSAEKTEYQVILDGTPYDFVWLIKNATAICTDSFHACVFSNIYNKDFYLLKRERKAEDSKYTGLFNMFGNSYRIVKDENVFIEYGRTDEQRVNSVMSSNREKSYDYLKQLLTED